MNQIREVGGLEWQNEKKRILQLFYILAQQDQYIRSYELAEKVGVTGTNGQK